MHKLKSLDSFELDDQGTVFIVKCPICVQRNMKALMQEFSPVEIDGSTERYTNLFGSNPTA